MDFILQWGDLIWLPAVFLAVGKGQRLITLGFLAGCMVMMRLQVELMYSIGHPGGLTPFLDWDVHFRALSVYSVFYVVYIAVAVYSPKSERALFASSALSVFFAALVSSTIVMMI